MTHNTRRSNVCTRRLMRHTSKRFACSLRVMNSWTGQKCKWTDSRVGGMQRWERENDKKNSTVDLEWRTWSIRTTFFSFLCLAGARTTLAFSLISIHQIYPIFADQMINNGFVNLSLFSLIRNISSEKSSFIIVPSTSSQRCRVCRSQRWHFAGRKTYRRWIGSESVCIGRTMYGACIATGSCWRATWLEWYFEVTTFLIELYNNNNLFRFRFRFFFFLWPHKV